MEIQLKATATTDSNATDLQTLSAPQEMVPPGSVFLAGVSVTAVPNSDLYITTGASPITTPTPTIVNPSASVGVAQWIAGGTLSSSTALANGTTATTQSPADNSTKVATTAYVDAAAGANSVLKASLTTTSATTDNVTITGMTSSGHCALAAQNASAATNIATSFISAYTTNQITLTHTATASMIYDFICSAN